MYALRADWYSYEFSAGEILKLKVRIESVLWSWRYGIGGRNETHTPPTTPHVQNRPVRQPAEYFTGRKETNCMFIFFIFIYVLQLGCHPVAVVILHVNKT